MDQINDETKAKFDVFRASVETAGRNIRDIGIEATIWADDGDTDGPFKAAQGWAALGVTQLLLRPRGDVAAIQRTMSAFAPLLAELP